MKKQHHQKWQCVFEAPALSQGIKKRQEKPVDFCVRATKKIFSAILHMNSNLCIEMKYRLRRYEALRLGAI